MPRDPVPRTAIFTPTQAELAVPLQEFRGASRLVEGPLRIEVGSLYGVEVVLVRTGMGAANAAAAAERVLEAFTVSEVLLIGFAGGTQPGLETPDLVACSELTNLAGNSGKVASSPALIERAQRTGLISATEPSVTVGRVISSARDKQDLGRKHGAAVVEMEGFPVLREAHLRRVPGLMVRAVLDPVEMSFPDASHLLRDSGEPRALALLAHLAAHPTHIFVFYELMKRVQACRRALLRFLKSYLIL